MKKMILKIAIVTSCILYFNVKAKAQHDSDTVYYFIDADMKLPALAGTGPASGIYASTPIRTALWKEHETLINEFKVKLKERFPNQPGAGNGVVFRWQPSMKEVTASYALKEAKMKKENYSVVQLR